MSKLLALGLREKPALKELVLKPTLFAKLYTIVTFMKSRISLICDRLFASGTMVDGTIVCITSFGDNASQNGTFHTFTFNTPELGVLRTLVAPISNARVWKNVVLEEGLPKIILFCPFILSLVPVE